MMRKKHIKFITDPSVMQILTNVKATIRDAKTGKIKRIKHYHNIVVDTGKAIIAEFLGQTTPSISTLSPNYCAVGTSSTSAVAGDTQLVAELDRTIIASKSFLGNVVYLTAFFGTTDGNGTIRETGLFIDANSDTNDGLLFNRVVVNITKSISETLTIDFVITIN